MERATILQTLLVFLLCFPSLSAAERPEENPCPQLTGASVNGKLVLIIDDIGHHKKYGRQAVDLPGPVTLAVLPHTPFGTELAERAHSRGHEVMLHAPMSNLGNKPLGGGALTADLDEAEFRRRLNEALDQVPHVRGVNNHMGSDLTQQGKQMAWLMQVLRQRQLYFVDSRTSHLTVAAHTAAASDIPHLSRNVFLDNERDREAIHERFELALAMAEDKGVAVAIGHPHPETLDYLRETLPTLATKGVELQYVSEALGLDSEPHLDTALGHIGLGLGHCVLAEVEDTGGQHRVGTPLDNSIHEVVEVADTP